MEHPLEYGAEPVGRTFAPVEIVDVGCGYGGLLFALSLAFPQTRCLGLEIRDKVTNYVAKKIFAMRIEHPGEVTSTSVPKHLCAAHQCHEALAQLHPSGSAAQAFLLLS